MKTLTFETVLTSPDGFNVPTASPLQLAICRAADGKPIGRLLNRQSCLSYFGCERDELGRVRPKLVYVIAGIRGGKTVLCCAAVTVGALEGDLSKMPRHEVSRCSIVSATEDNARATFRMLVGFWQESPLLRKMIVGEPTADTLTVKRPDGRVVEIVVVASSRGGVTLRSRWQIVVVFEELALMNTEESGAVVHVEALVIAAEGRLVKGGQIWGVTSPYGPSGLAFDVYTKHFGKPGRTLVVHAPTAAMNPTFPKETIEEIRLEKPDVAAREFDAEWVDAETAFLDGPQIIAAQRAAPLEEAPIKGIGYGAAQDPATRGNAWTFVLARHEKDTDRYVVALAREWIGSKKFPLDPERILGEIKAICQRYGVKRIASDGWNADSLISMSKHLDLEIHSRSRTTKETYTDFDHVRVLLATGKIELPPHKVLASDLRSVRKVASSKDVKIVLPRTANGRHADFAPSVALAVANAPAAARRGPVRDGSAPPRVPHRQAQNPFWGSDEAPPPLFDDDRGGGNQPLFNAYVKRLGGPR